MINQKYNFVVIDLLKIIGIVFVISRHLHWYFNVEYNKLSSSVISIIGELGADIFLFCSAFGLTASFLNKKPDLKSYWGKRLIRIYPLYLISLTLYAFFIYNIDYVNFLVHALFLHNFFLGMSHNPEPLWFIGIIIQFYIIFPLLYNCMIKNPKIFWVISFILYLINAIIIHFINIHIGFTSRLESSVEDSSVFTFILILSFGMYMSKEIYKKNRESIKIIRKFIYSAVILVSIIVFIYLFRHKSNFELIYSMGKLVFPVYSSFLIFLFIEFFNTPINNTRIIKIISSSTFCAYLFHEFIFCLVGEVSKMYVIGIVIGIPLTFLVSIAIQKMYDSISLKFKNSPPRSY